MRWFFGKRRSPDAWDGTEIGMTLGEKLKEERDRSDVAQEPEPSAASVPAFAPDSGSDASPQTDIGTDSFGGGFDGGGGGSDPS